MEAAIQVVAMFCLEQVLVVQRLEVMEDLVLQVRLVAVALVYL
jgi:hypothetical protein